MKNIAIITARSGSKGLTDKNIRLLADKPLMAYSIEAALNSGSFDTVMVSTDSEKYSEIAREYGAEVPFLRSRKNSGDRSGSWDVVREVLSGYEATGKRFDTVCLLQPTSPLRSSEDIVKAYGLLADKKADAITSVCECDHPMEYMMTLDSSLSLAEYRKNESNVTRQMMSTCYRLNGAIYIRRIDYSYDKIEIKSGQEYAYIMDRKRSIDIDTIDDFEYAQFLIDKERRADPG